MVNKMLEQLGVKPAKPMAILAGLAEFVGGILVMLGFITPLAALALIVVMIVAVITVHLRNGFFVTSLSPMGATSSTWRLRGWP